MPACEVCGLLLDKERVHYGGISCYSCRQFFRRVTNTGGGKTCSWEGKCVEHNWEQKMCQACRYQKCLAAGMQTDQVLSEESKKQRFKKSNLREDVFSGHGILWNVSDTDESSDESFEFPTITDIKKDDYSHESCLDPETGLAVNLSKRTPSATLEEYSTHESLLDPETGLAVNLSEWTQSATDKKLEVDGQILHYVHKKFGKSSFSEEEKVECIPTNSIMDVVLHPQSGDGSNIEVFYKKNSSETEKSQR